MRNLARKAALLNQLHEERERLTTELRRVNLTTSYHTVVGLKKQYHRISNRIAVLESEFRK